MNRIPRISRQYLDTQYYHIMVQGIKKEYIFEDDRMKKKYIKLLQIKAIKNKVAIIAYCIMDNHAHMLLKSQESRSISRLMSNINTSYAQYYNKVEDRVGYVFRDRYRAEPIMTNSHLYNCISYIHNNPVKAGMVKTCGDYKYSSYNDYINNKIDQELLVELFGKKVGYMNIITVESDNCEFIEVDNEFGNPKKEKFEEIKKEYINENFNDSRNVYRVSKELKNRCGITNEKIYQFMRISKYKYYQIMKELNDE